MQIDIVVAGGGAAGMMAALTCQRQGKNVLLLEQKDRIGKKILVTGNGKCNFTNRVQEKSCYRSSQLEFPWYALNRFGAEETIAFFEKLGILPKERNGYVYPYSGQASAIQDVLRFELERLGVRIVCGKKITNIEKAAKGFRVKYGDEIVSCKKVILAAGGKAASVHGSDGSGFRLAKKMGHSLTKLCPALTGLKANDAFCKALGGVRTDAAVSLFVDRKFVIKDTGELQLVQQGISGIPVFQVSRYAGMALLDKKKVTAEIDFFPGLTEQELWKNVSERKRRFPESPAEEGFTGLFHKKILFVLLKECGIRPQQRMQDIGIQQLKDMCFKMKRFIFHIVDINGFDNAQVCAGGVDTAEVKEQTMESKLVNDLYFAGEILDVDGICGGYNLQWAWSSGYLAGLSAAGEEGKQ